MAHLLSEKDWFKATIKYKSPIIAEFNHQNNPTNQNHIKAHQNNQKFMNKSLNQKNALKKTQHQKIKSPEDNEIN